MSNSNRVKGCPIVSFFRVWYSTELLCAKLKKSDWATGKYVLRHEISRDFNIRYILVDYLYWIYRHYGDVIMDTMTSRITSLTVVYSAVYSGTDQRKHQSSASLAFVRGIHRWPVKSARKGPVRRQWFPFDDVIMVFVYFCPMRQHCLVSDTCVIIKFWGKHSFMTKRDCFAILRKTFNLYPLPWFALLTYFVLVF